MYVCAVELRCVCMIHLRQCVSSVLRCKLAASFHCKARNSHLCIAISILLFRAIRLQWHWFPAVFFTLRTYVHTHVNKDHHKVHLPLLPLIRLAHTCSPLHLLLACCGKLVINSTQRAVVRLRRRCFATFLVGFLCLLCHLQIVIFKHEFNYVACYYYRCSFTPLTWCFCFCFLLAGVVASTTNVVVMRSQAFQFYVKDEASGTHIRNICMCSTDCSFICYYYFSFLLLCS